MTTDPAGVQARINHYWNERGASYDASLGHGIRSDAEHGAWLAALRRLLPDQPSQVLDVGTGTGFLALLAAEIGHRVTGIDLADGMLALARAKAQAGTGAVTFERGDANSPAYPPASFDVIVSRHVIWTLRDPDQAFANWWRLLRPGGRVIAIDSLWFMPSGDEDDDADRQEETPLNALWEECYSAETKAALPVMSLATLDPLLERFRAAGFASVVLESLDDVERVEQIARPQPRYVLIAERAA